MHSKRATRGRAAGGPRGGLRVEAPGAGRARGGPETLYWRAELLEVDGVLEDGHGSWAIEVKTRPFGAADGHGLLRVREAFPCYRPIPPLRPGGA